MTTANLPDMQAPVVFCQECATGFCLVIWDVDHNGEPTVVLSDNMNYCPVCGGAQRAATNALTAHRKVHINLEELAPRAPKEMK